MKDVIYDNIEVSKSQDFTFSLKDIFLEQPRWVQIDFSNRFNVKKIESDEKTKDDTFYSNSKAGEIINKRDTGGVFETNYTTIISNIQKSLEKGLS